MNKTGDVLCEPRDISCSKNTQFDGLDLQHFNKSSNIQTPQKSNARPNGWCHPPDSRPLTCLTIKCVSETLKRVFETRFNSNALVTSTDHLQYCFYCVMLHSVRVLNCRVANIISINLVSIILASYPTVSYM